MHQETQRNPLYSEERRAAVYTRALHAESRTRTGDREALRVQGKIIRFAVDNVVYLREHHTRTNESVFSTQKTIHAHIPWCPDHDHKTRGQPLGAAAEDKDGKVERSTRRYQAEEKTRLAVQCVDCHRSMPSRMITIFKSHVAGCGPRTITVAVEGLANRLRRRVLRTGVRVTSCQRTPASAPMMSAGARPG